MGIDFRIHVPPIPIQISKFSKQIARRFRLAIGIERTDSFIVYRLGDDSGASFSIFDLDPDEPSLGKPISYFEGPDRRVNFRWFDPFITKPKHIVHMLMLREMLDRFPRVGFERESEVLLVKSNERILLRHDSWKICESLAFRAFIPGAFEFVNLPEFTVE